jgi:regulator of sigma E protease
MSWIAAIGGLAVLILLHEFGHFIVAKAVGMRVERFMLFFPPVVWKVKRGETEYGIGAIPLGGYVKISGMNPREDLPPEVRPRAYFRQKPWKRIAVILAGPAMNLIVAFFLFFGIFVIHGEPTDQVTNRVVTVTNGGPVGSILRPGDRLIAVDGVHGPPGVLRLQIGTHGCPTKPREGCKGTPAQLTYIRDGQVRHATARPAFDAANNRPLLGFSFDTKVASVSAGAAAGDAVSGMWRVTKASVSAIGKLFYSEKSRKQVSGIVGITTTTSNAFGSDAVTALFTLGIISLSLAIINLFPFLPLDGGHVFWALAEKVRGRPIPFSVMERAGVIGMVLVVFLFVIGLTNDIDRIQHKGFGVP